MGLRNGAGGEDGGVYLDITKFNKEIPDPIHNLGAAAQRFHVGHGGNLSVYGLHGKHLWGYALAMSDAEDREWNDRFGESYLGAGGVKELNEGRLDQLEEEFLQEAEVPDRRGTGCIKWDLAGPDEIPLWVAD